MQQTESVERAVMRALHKRFGVPITYSDDKGYLSQSLDPREHSDLASFKRHYFIYSFLRKWKGLDAGLDLERATFDGWRAAEVQCFKTNRRLETECSTGVYSVASSVILDAQRKIAQILGACDVEKIAPLCGHSTGATFDLRRGSTLADKMLKKPTVTFDCLKRYLSVTEGDAHFAHVQGYDFEFVRGNRCVMVPKSAKINRMIAAEPTLNTFVQQGVGRYFRSRLKRFGIDLDDQTINQDRAFHALVDGLTTLDLSMASDTMCYNIVKLLLPREWFDLLRDIRSPVSTYGGKTYLNSKFSSMGNSCTFELESLIFYALCWASKVDHDDVNVTVYGDDLIFGDKSYQSVLKTLNWAGFVVNEDKSFTAGSRFYESCGRHYFDLEEVTPPYQKEICQRPADFIRLHNRLYRAGKRLNLSNEVIDVCRFVRDECERRFGSKYRLVGPDVEGDAFFINPSFDFGSKDKIKLEALVRVPKLIPCTEVREHAYFMYKMRRPDRKNTDRKGRCLEEGDAHYAIKRVAIWRSAVRMD